MRKPRVKNKYNLDMKKVKKLRVGDRTKIGQPLFWRNNVIDAWCILGTTAKNSEDEAFGTCDEFWIGVYDEDAKSYAGKVRVTFSSYGGMCGYNFDKFFDLDMQKDTVVKKISSVTLNPSGKNKAIVVSSIGKTVIYDENGYILETIDGGYLDIGLNDTMKDLLVNFIGAVVFCSFAYLALRQNKKNNFIDKFIPTKEKRPMASSVIKEIEDRKELAK